MAARVRDKGKEPVIWSSMFSKVFATASGESSSKCKEHVASEQQSLLFSAGRGPIILRVKLCFKESIRLVTIAKCDRLQSLKALIKSTFEELEDAPLQSLVVTYLDAEGDTISVAKDEDLLLALKECRSLGPVLKFVVTAVKSFPRFQPSSSVQGSRKACRYHATGFCRKGSKCNLLHSDTVAAGPSNPHFMNLLQSQLGKSSADNIEYLSSTYGMKMVHSIIESRNLSERNANLFVKLLVKDDIRTSMRRQETNKIYGALMGSTFLMKLHIHLRSLRRPSAEDVKPYLSLMEELQSRTAAGWREVPLDVLKSVVEDLPETHLKTEMHQRVLELVEHRRRLQLQTAIRAPDKCLQGPGFRNITIIPSKEEICLPESEVVLPVNKVGLRYASVIEYLETHFRLLREDCIQPLRKGIKDYRSGSCSSEVRVYENVQILEMRLGNSGIEIRVKIADARNFEGNLKFGSLLCMSQNGFESFMWATVSVCDERDQAKGIVSIQLSGEYKGFETSRNFSVIESSAAYFEAYSHVLKSLQREVMEEIPFMEHLISLEPIVREPAYFLQRKNRDIYELKCVFPEFQEKTGLTSIHLLQDWPEWSCSLDESQKNALKHGLTKRLALIQGPPGTGKTFIGLLIVQLLLANLQKMIFNRRTPESDLKGPILVVCYTNHALDQFLEGIFRKEKHLIRMGGRCKSEVLEKCVIRNIVREAGAEARARGRAKEKCSNLKENVAECLKIMNSIHVTEGLLHGVATEEQISNLFYDPWLKDTVTTWLQSDPDPTAPNDEVESWYSDSPGESETNFEDAESGDSDAAFEETEDCQEENSAAPYFYDSDDYDRIPDNHWLQQQPVKMNQPMPFHAVLHEPCVWDLPNEERKRLHQYWLEEIHKTATQRFADLCKEYEAACQEYKEADWELTLSTLRKVKLVGMTTTCAGRLHELLLALKPEIVIVEEAAEVLESHILSCISPHTKHLILIGDHLQLRPSVATHKLAVENKLDISLFERLVEGGVEHATLEVQRRMKPCISKLISSIYPRLKNHPRVMEYEDIKGFTSSMFFLDHKAPEKNSNNDDGKSKVNLVEAELVVELCNYLLKQGSYEPKDITVLAMYKGQVEEITKRLGRRLNFPVRAVGYANPATVQDDMAKCMPRVSSVDDFQGEENKIIVLSLVRSNLIPGKDGAGKIGFLNTSNRVCVALSRAKMGLYIFGNAELLAQKSPLWNSIIGNLKADGLIGPELRLCCQNHPEVETLIKQVQDFKQVQDGGCTRACEYQLGCGHVCPRRCHPGSHEGFICPKRCLKPLEGCPHRCNRACHGTEDCPPCQQLVKKHILECGHMQSMICSVAPDHSACLNPCKKLLPCGHQCTNTCGSSCLEKCLEIVPKALPCGHIARIACSKVATECYELVLRVLPCGHEAEIPCIRDPSEYQCGEPCLEILEGCHHQCKGTCSKCKQGTKHIECQHTCGRDLPCGHQCNAKCSTSCPPCNRKCQKRCVHSRCSLTCGDLCKPCLEPCSWRCRHYKCKLLCYEVCKRPRCNKPCKKRIRRCGHPCIGLCGEPCPKKCRACHPQIRDVITQMTLEESDESDRFVELMDCGHIFEVSGLDRWMDETNEISSNGSSEAILLKTCPECKTPIRRTPRYANVVKKRLLQIEEVKKRVHGYEMLRLGVDRLRIKDVDAAIEYFQDAIRYLPGLLEAHFNIACAFYSTSEHVKAVAHLRLVVSRSTFANLVSHIPELPAQKNPYSPVPRRRVHITAATAGGSQAIQSLATQALVQWASVLASLKQSDVAIQLCDIVQKHGHENHEAAVDLKKKIGGGIGIHQVLQAMSTRLSSRGTWHQCPNGHYYVVGECGRPCPDCRAVIGGERHVAAAGNVRVQLQLQ